MDQLKKEKAPSTFTCKTDVSSTQVISENLNESGEMNKTPKCFMKNQVKEKINH